MLQIIGWLGCVMLAVKLLEMSANPALQTEEGKPKGALAFALLIGWLGVFCAAFLLALLGSSVPTQPLRASDVPGPLTDAQIECISRSRTAEETVACTE